MARPKVSAWSAAPRDHHPARQAGFEFETQHKARSVDRRNGRSLEQLQEPNRQVRRIARSLLDRQRRPRNMASARTKRSWKLVFVGQLSWLIARQGKKLWLCTGMPYGWLIPATELPDADPRRLREQLRAVFNRAKLGQAGGWAYFVLDIEYIEHLNAYSFHVHGIATSRIARRFRALRDRPKFRWPEGSIGAPRRPIQVKRINRGEGARVANYLPKTYFGCRVYRLERGQYIRTAKRVRIPEPRHSEMLLWLARWSIDDFVLPVNLYFGQGQLEVSSRG